MAITSLDLLNTRIDLSDVLSWRIAQSPQFINLFSAPVADGGDGAGIIATATEHKWLEGVETPKTKAFTAYAFSGQNGTFTVESSAGWVVGDLFHILGDSTVLRVASVTDTTIVPAVVAKNGSAIDFASYSAPNGGTLIFDSRPIQEGSTEGENMFLQSGQESNFTQIFRADIALTGTATAIGQYGNENNVEKPVTCCSEF